MIVKTLQKIGLTASESNVFLALYGLTETTVGPLVDKSGVASSKIYPLLEKLKQRGLVSEISKHNVKHFQAVTPTRLLELVKIKAQEIVELENEVKKIIPQLKKIETIEDKETKMFEGLQGYAGILSEMLETVETKYYVFGATRELTKPELGIVQKHLQYLKEKSVAVKIIYPGKTTISSKFGQFTNVSVRRSISNHPGTIIITDTAIALISWDEPSTQVLIKSKTFAKMYQEEFETTWEEAK